MWTIPHYSIPAWEQQQVGAAAGQEQQQEGAAAGQEQDLTQLCGDNQTKQEK